jgi:hypothetical protein
MLFEHPETGLKLIVREFDETETFSDTAGKSREIVTRTRLNTGAGQLCQAVTDELREIDVLTNRGVIRLIRCDAGW